MRTVGPNRIGPSAYKNRHVPLEAATPLYLRGRPANRGLEHGPKARCERPSEVH
jgi:hypothetical protein